MGTTRACLVASTAAAFLLAGAGYAYQPPTVTRGSAYRCTISVSHRGLEERRVSLHARLRGHRFWNSTGQAAIHGPWVALDPVVVASREWAELVCDLPVPEDAPAVLDVETRADGEGIFTLADGGRLPLVEPAPPLVVGPRAGRVRVPFRIVAGGFAAWDPEGLPALIRGDVARTGEEWAALRDFLGISPPESWHLEEPSVPYGDPVRASFASTTAPDLAAETLLSLRSTEHSLRFRPLRFLVRSVDREPDGTLVCRYTFRYRNYGRGVFPAIWERGSYLVIAIPRTDAPIEFRRVP